MRNRFDESDDAQRVIPSGQDRSLLCTRPGCGRRWTCDFGRRLCSEHDAARHTAHVQQQPSRTRSLPSIPTLRQAVRSFAEPDEHDEEFA